MRKNTLCLLQGFTQNLLTAINNILIINNIRGLTYIIRLAGISESQAAPLTADNGMLQD